MKPSLLLFSAVLANKSYIVILKDEVQTQQHINGMKMRISKVGKSEIKQTYNSDIIKGYSGEFDDETIDEISKSKDVDFVEENGRVKTNELYYGAPWGICRVSSIYRQNSTSGTYKCHSNGGDGVNVYIIDTGININHVDFEGRASWGTTTAEGSQDDDGNGHGTHVAGTIGGKSYGVSKKAKLIAVKVLSDEGSGSWADVIKGIEWAAEHAQKSGGVKGNVANLSLGGSYSKSINKAIKNGSKYLTYVVAAGNDNEDACNYSPASEPSAITVAASNINDQKASFSNWGKCVSIIAPGQAILSSWVGSNTATKTISGTSMASPHVAGVVAYLLSEQNLAVPVQKVRQSVLDWALKNKISGFESSTSPYFVHNNT